MYSHEVVQINVVEEDKQEIKDQVFAFMCSIINEQSVSYETLSTAANMITPMDYDAIIEERDINKYCAWPICSNDVKSNLKKPKSIYKKGEGFVDVSEKLLYCSKDCLQKSKIFKALLKVEPLWIRDRTLPDVDISCLR